MSFDHSIRNVVEMGSQPSLTSRIDRLEQCVNVLCAAVQFFAQKEKAAAEKAVASAAPRHRVAAEVNHDETAAMLKSLLEIADLAQKQVRSLADERRAAREVLEAKIADLNAQLLRL